MLLNYGYFMALLYKNNVAINKSKKNIFKYLYIILKLVHYNIYHTIYADTIHKLIFIEYFYSGSDFPILTNM